MKKIKELFKYEKIVATILIPVMGFVASYIRDLNHKIESLENWKIQIETRNTVQKMSDFYVRIGNLEKDQSLTAEKLDTVREKQDDRAKRSNIKFDDHEKAIKQNAVDIAYLKGACKRKQ